MAEETDFENGRISNFQRHVTLTLDRATWRAVVHHSSTSTYTPNFTQIGETFCGRTFGRMYGRMDGRTDIEAGFIRSSRRFRPNNHNNTCNTKKDVYSVAIIA